MLKARASCPVCISFLFRVCPNRNLLKMGSIGASCTVDKKVTVEVKKSRKTEIFFNNKKINFPTVLYVIDKLAKSPVSVFIKSPLPLGYGFSISGASTLATTSSLNKLFHLKKTRFELAKIAHFAEIVNHTGLGNIGTQITGGFLLKTRPGLPVSAIKLPFVGQKLYAVIIDRLLTPSILKDKKMVQKVNSATDYYLEHLMAKIENKTLQLADIIQTGCDFVTSVDLLTDARLLDIISRIKILGGVGTMAILGRVVITDINPTFVKDYPVVELTVTDDFAELL